VKVSRQVEREVVNHHAAERDAQILAGFLVELPMPATIHGDGVKGQLHKARERDRKALYRLRALFFKLGRLFGLAATAAGFARLAR
jgi:hypothetical protein